MPTQKPSADWPPIDRSAHIWSNTKWRLVGSLAAVPGKYIGPFTQWHQSDRQLTEKYGNFALTSVLDNLLKFLKICTDVFVFYQGLGCLPVEREKHASARGKQPVTPLACKQNVLLGRSISRIIEYSAIYGFLGQNYLFYLILECNFLCKWKEPSVLFLRVDYVTSKFCDVWQKRAKSVTWHMFARCRFL